MFRLRHAMVAAAMFGMLGAGAASTVVAAPAAGNPAVAHGGHDRDCAKLGPYGAGWAKIYNKCGRGIKATVDLHYHSNPGCVWVDAYGWAYINFHEHAWPKYAYEC